MTLAPFVTNTPFPTDTRVATVTSAPSATPSRTATRLPPTPIISIVFGSGAPRILIVQQGTLVLQCQVGGINCAVPLRRAGAGLR
ncbi:MAG: hypothetical protein U0670_17520 [Anaerolineae bacterium]